MIARFYCRLELGGWSGSAYVACTRRCSRRGAQTLEVIDTGNLPVPHSCPGNPLRKPPRHFFNRWNLLHKFGQNVDGQKFFLSSKLLLSEVAQRFFFKFIDRTIFSCHASRWLNKRNHLLDLPCNSGQLAWCCSPLKRRGSERSVYGSRRREKPGDWGRSEDRQIHTHVWAEESSGHEPATPDSCAFPSTLLRQNSSSPLATCCSCLRDDNCLV